MGSVDPTDCDDAICDEEYVDLFTKVGVSHSKAAAILLSTVKGSAATWHGCGAGGLCPDRQAAIPKQLDTRQEKKPIYETREHGLRDELV